MRRRWQIALPLVGLILFFGETIHSVRFNLTNYRSSYRYFWWGATRLDKTPGQLTLPIPCHSTSNPIEDCNSWEPEYIWTGPSVIEDLLILAALPAFAMGLVIVEGLGRIGVNQVTSFFVSMPVLICVWFYLAGLLADRILSRHRFVESPGSTRTG